MAAVMHMRGTIDDEVRWDAAGDDFDAEALEAAMRAARREAYAPLAELDPPISEAA